MPIWNYKLHVSYQTNINIIVIQAKDKKQKALLASEHLNIIFCTKKNICITKLSYPLLFWFLSFSPPHSGKINNLKLKIVSRVPLFSSESLR